MKVTLNAVALAVLAATAAMACVSAAAQGPATLENLLGGEGSVQTQPFVQPVEPRLPVPTAADVQNAQDLIRQAYEEDYAAADKEPRRLIDKLLATADDVDDSTRRYALFVEVERVAISAGDIHSALEASSLRCRCFDEDSAESRLAVLIAATKPEQRDETALFRMFIEFIDHALTMGRIDLADRAVAEAAATAKRAERRDRLAAAEERKRTGRKPPGGLAEVPSPLDEVLAKQRLIKVRKKAVAEYEVAKETLLEKPDDAKAHGVVGRYLCFVLANWSEGLSALQRSDSERLRAAAGQEVLLIAEDAAKPQALLDVAGAWWKIAEGADVTSEMASTIKSHAAGIYEKALPKLDDPIERALASKRIAAVKNEVEIAMPASDSQTVGKSVERKRAGALKIPSSSILPAPMNLSPALASLLPTEPEIAAVRNHANVADGDVRRAKHAFLERIYKGCDAQVWTAVDAVYVIGLLDRMNEMTGTYSAVGPNWSMGGSRDSCKAAIAAVWVLAAKSEKDFASRMRILQAEPIERQSLDRAIREYEAKQWLISLGPEYSSVRRKIQAIDYLIQQGVATDGMRKYREDLTRVGVASER